MTVIIVKLGPESLGCHISVTPSQPPSYPALTPKVVAEKVRVATVVSQSPIRPVYVKQEKTSGLFRVLDKVSGEPSVAPNGRLRDGGGFTTKNVAHLTVRGVASAISRRKNRKKAHA